MCICFYNYYFYSQQVTGVLVKAIPLRACEKLDNEGEIQGKIVIIERGDCMFIEKVSHS